MGTIQRLSEEPAMAGRAVCALGLLATGGLVLAGELRPRGSPIRPTPLWMEVGVILAPAIVLLGALLSAKGLEADAEADLTGRALAAGVVGVPALLAFLQGELFFASSGEVLLLFVGLVLAVAAGGLLFWFLFGIHRALRPSSKPVFLLAAAASVLAGVIVDADPYANLLLVSAPAALVAISILRPSQTPHGGSPEPADVSRRA